MEMEFKGREWWARDRPLNENSAFTKTRVSWTEPLIFGRELAQHGNPTMK